MSVKELELEDIVGADNVTLDEETCRIYSEDAGNLPGLASQIIRNRFDIIAQPVTVESIQALLRYAKRYRLTVVPRGNGTSGWGGSIPSKGGICLSLTQMIKVIHLDDFGRTVTVESGITWRELLMFLERLGMTLPVYPSSATAATIGGFVASGGIGIGSSKHGSIVEQVVGLEAVLANGKLVRVGELALGSTPDPLEKQALEGTDWLKRIAGESALDLKEVLTETYGTIGIITKVTLRTVPMLQLLPFACSFDNMEDLTESVKQVLEEAEPYHLRYLDSNHTSKLSALIGSPLEWDKYILAGALHGTIYDNEEGMDAVSKIVEDNHGTMLAERRANFYWSERLFPLRFKRQGPSLVPAEVMVPIDNLPQLHEDTLGKLGGSKFAVEGTIGSDGFSSYLVWILDDERKRLRYTIGWHRSFDIAGLAPKHGGHAYAVALWNTRHAIEYYGEERYKQLVSLKKQLDPDNSLNPMKVFGGRAHVAWQSQAFGFLTGFLVALLAGSLGPGILGLAWLQDIVSSVPFTFLPLQLLWFISLAGGALGLLVMRMMTLAQALAIGIPLLRFADRVLRI
ncbi:MAG: FAD-binding oxidoreductase [Candidatus Thorarchaeota archaeon]